ncbi:MAG: CAP domain-containing protein [Solirubrobacterales bacterium]
MRRGHTTATLGALVAVLFCALWLFAAPASAVSEDDWLGRVNEIRLGSQLPPVSENSSWSAGIAAHLRYLALTGPEYRTGEYQSAHTENPASPYYTPEGDKEARSSDITFASSSNLDAINEWLTAPFHAIGMLRPGLQQVAFAREAPGGSAGLDVISGLTFPAEPQLVLFPGPGATIDLPRFRGESPTPLETCEAQHPGADYGEAGLPLIALLPEAPDPDTGATLTNPSGSQVSSSGDDLCVVTEHDFTTSDSVYGPSGQEILEADKAVIVIPRTPLTEGTYTVDITQPGKQDIVWSFDSNPPKTTTGARLRVRIGHPHFKQRFVYVRLDNSHGSEAVRCQIRSNAGYRRTMRVPQEEVIRLKARLHRYGRSVVAVRANGRLRARRTFRGPSRG